MNKFIFVHIQKTGGDSVRGALRLPTFPEGKHYGAREYIKIVGEDTWRRSYTFSFVRNPWDRLVSWWYMMKRLKNGRMNTLNPFARYIIENASTFEDFLCCDKTIVDEIGTKCIWRNQMDYLVDEDGRVLVDYIGRYERLKECFGHVCQVLGRDVELPHKNKTKHDHYSAYYTRSLADMVGERYAWDIENFGYAF